MDKVSRLKVAQVVGKYKNGRYAEYPHLIRHVRTDRVRILCDQPASISLDGELQVAQEIEICLAPEKVRFFYPRGLSWQTVTPELAASAK